MNNILIVCVSIFMTMIPLKGYTDCDFNPTLGNVIHGRTLQTDSLTTVQIAVDLDRSKIQWKGTEMWQSSSHEGTVSLEKGYLELEKSRVVGGYFLVDMNSISITDIPEDEPVPRSRLRNHLKSDDFFYVDQYPNAQLRITETEVISSNKLRAAAVLTIKDVTKPISFVIQRINKGEPASYRAELIIDRFEWNISYQGSYWQRISSIIDNNLVDTDIQLSVIITLVK